MKSRPHHAFLRAILCAIVVTVSSVGAAAQEAPELSLPETVWCSDSVVLRVSPITEWGGARSVRTAYIGLRAIVTGSSMLRLPEWPAALSSASVDSVSFITRKEEDSRTICHRLALCRVSVQVLFVLSFLDRNETHKQIRRYADTQIQYIQTMVCTELT